MKFNIPEFTVSEFSRSIKRLVEDAFGYVRIKGEITGFKKATSGHLYFTLKDENSVISAVCFRNSANLIDFDIEDGLKVIASGRITTYEGRSNYQIIIEKLEVAGIGALMEIIEKRRQKLAKEGLFDEKHKKPIPFFPKKIGIITSKTGAVIEDIKHRIENRCPTHLMLYNSLVQGEKAAKSIIEGLKFFNNDNFTNKPEVIIIARGGGSFEDLLPFNEEQLIREVFNSKIPIISAIGHETDTTLIDYVSDLRAPTPTAAAEIITPLLSDLKNQLTTNKIKLKELPEKILQQQYEKITNLSKFIIDPKIKLKQIQEHFLALVKKLDLLTQNHFNQKQEKIRSMQISKEFLSQKITTEKQKSEFLLDKIENQTRSWIKNSQNNLNHITKLLQTNNYKQILTRGFALIKHENGQLASSAKDIKNKEKVTIQMNDGTIKANICKL